MAFVIKKGYQDPKRAEKEKAYQYLVSLGITMPKSDHPENLFLIGVPADADTYDKYAAAIAARTIKLFGRMLALKEPREMHERNLLAILAVNAIAFSFNHKLPAETETVLSEYLAVLTPTCFSKITAPLAMAICTGRVCSGISWVENPMRTPG